MLFTEDSRFYVMLPIGVYVCFYSYGGRLTCARHWQPMTTFCVGTLSEANIKCFG